VLISPAATAVLGSALCSLSKVAVQHTQAVKAAAAAAAGDAREDVELSQLLLSSPILLFSGPLTQLVNELLPAIRQHGQQLPAAAAAAAAAAVVVAAMGVAAPMASKPGPVLCFWLCC
jgi:hypothetical protein